MKDILRPIGVVSRALDSIANIEFKEMDLSRGQYLYLVRICESPGIILERLANMLKVDKTTAARSIQKLELKGLIERRSDHINRKIKMIYPTEKGEAVYPVLQREERYSNSVAMRGFSKAEQDQLFELMERVANNVDDDWKLVKGGSKRNY
ncbi:MarR family winged helix-turn-helix transcriptional regulator [Companilactobacillus ginsenosidimutans]|uniref:MarR family transcriptional regulator n=1 Tax=Companilactobacillus ginsenosidimutans TaxID=1007676 RepID=A0A0H4QI09_9LACO|nr:MarR family transcriptional regulator [Companilactobacillus ginsenosidimutans]AKP66278.1 MarR family transcriptional regulator [Companilactobacillus ginsenosidimutans]